MATSKPMLRPRWSLKKKNVPSSVRAATTMFLLSTTIILQSIVLLTVSNTGIIFVYGNDDIQHTGNSASESTQATPPGGAIPDPSIPIEGSNRDRFSYGETRRGTDGGPNVFGPRDWGSIGCTNSDICLGYPDKYRNAQGWEIDETNHCMSCPFEQTGSCGIHHNSPTNLQRNVAVNESSFHNPCVDPHWMEYRDSSCTFQELKEKNAFTIERHAARITQPTNWNEYVNDLSKVYKIDCTNPNANKKRAWGIIDFPRGYSDWYYLSHIDFKVPSEHYQEGVRYDGEIQLHHFYSVTGEVAGVHNQAGAVAIMMKVVDQVTDWPELNKVICAWRETEDRIREECGLPSILIPYPGCTPYRRNVVYPPPPPEVPATNTTDGDDDSATEKNSTSIDTDTNNSTDTNIDQDNNGTVATQGADFRKLKRQPYIPAKAMLDILSDHRYESFHNSSNNKPVQNITIDHHNSAIDLEDIDWDAFIAEQYKIDEQQRTQQQHMRSGKNHKRRRLLNYEEVDWFNYFPMLRVKTEYYYRYEGSQTIPPCYGKFISSEGDRRNTVAWRVMKDPVLVSQRQIDELHRLLKNRIAPKSDVLNSCNADTAAGPDPNGDPNKITVARPLQSMSNPHFTTFCECANWKSKFIEDNNWCGKWKETTKQGRFYERPYNFKTNLSSFV